MTPSEEGLATGTAQLWAKTGPDEAWHPLGAHLVDAALVARQLWRYWLSDATRRWLAEPLCADEDAAGSFFSFLAGCHDLGKASPAFQVQVDWLADKVRTGGIPLAPKLPLRKKAPHALVSAATIGPILQKRYGWTQAATDRVAAILGGHHGWFPVEGFTLEPKKRPDLYGWSPEPTAPWMAARAELCELIGAVSGANKVLDQLGDLELGRARELALAGYVVLADWIASNADLFPYASAPFDPSYVKVATRHAEKALHEIGWRQWEPVAEKSPIEGFERRFGFHPNALQCQTLVSVAKQSQPGLILVEAPMGIGKTEAALAAAELLASAHGLGGVFIGLPTQATSNQMFVRTKRWLEQLGSGTYVLELAHGKARQVAEYRELVAHGSPSCIDIDGEHDAFVTAEAWFGGPKRRLLAPFVVGTVDQVLMGSAKVRHVALRQVGLMGKVVIIDEVHAYGAHMSVFLRRALRWLGEAGVPVLLLTATLPPATRRRLAEAYAGMPLEVGEVGYPSVTTVSPAGEVVSATVVTDVPGSRVRIEEIDEKPDEPAGAAFVTAVRGYVDRGANVLVVRNTVVRAQRSYRAIADALGTHAVTLLHARFTAEHRLAKERWLADRFGPGGDRPAGHVVVGTQVLEQSLDVDFDVLVTDLAPVDLVLQRSGRVHRHPGVPRPTGCEMPIVVLGGMHQTAGGPPDFPRGSSTIYGDHLLLRTAAVLHARDLMSFPTEIPDLIAKVYGDDDLVPADWCDVARCAADAWVRRERAQEQAADQFAIPCPEGAPSLLELCRIGLDDPDDDDPGVQAAVRDAPATVEVVLGWEAGPGRVRFASGVDVSLDELPDPDGIDAILSSTLRLPPWVTPAARDLRGPEGWREHPWLRKLGLVVLDRAGEAEIDKYRVSYSEEIGLEVASSG